MTAAKSGIIAEFETAYLQREIRLVATVAGGTDKGVRNKEAVGYAVGRLVVVTGNGSGTNASPVAITAPTGVTATSIGNATHIIAQSDDTTRDEPSDYNEMEKYSSLPNLVCKNSTTGKTVAVYKIVNPDDIKLVNLGTAQSDDTTR